MLTQEDFLLALANIRREGDTDVFPELNYESITFEQVEQLDRDIMSSIPDVCEKYSPRITHGTTFKNYGTLRSATQIEPLFNIYYLMLAISVARQTEQNRIPAERNVVHSYRFLPCAKTGLLFAKEYNYGSYAETLRKQREVRYGCAFLCVDIKEFYNSVSCSCLAEILRKNGIDQGTVVRIARLLRFVGQDGLPVGGNASRILAELVLNELDQLLKSLNVLFARFVDDYTLFLTVNNSQTEVLQKVREFLNIKGMELNEKKTKLVNSRDFDMSYIDWRASDYLYLDEHCSHYNTTMEEELRGFHRSLTNIVSDPCFSLRVLNIIPNDPPLINSTAVQLSYLLRWAPKKFPAICRWIMRRREMLDDLTRHHIAYVARCLLRDNCEVLCSSVNRLHVESLMRLTE